MTSTGERLLRSAMHERRRGISERWTRLRVRSSLFRVPAPPALAEPPATETLDVRCVVFSKDRAMQLDACLRSIDLYAPYTGPIAVIYTASTPDFEEGYRQLERSERVHLVREGDFEADVRDELASAGEFVVFHTDDDLFFRRSPRAPFLPDGYAAFSLRLGRNTTYCYPYDRPQALPSSAATGEILAWDWRRAEYDFGYPLSLNGHVLRTALVQRLLENQRFRNPNELEHELNRRRHFAPPGLLSFASSSLVSVPANLVNAGFANRAAASNELSPEALNGRFLAGERIQFEQMDFSTVASPHCELPLAIASSLAEMS